MEERLGALTHSAKATDPEKCTHQPANQAALSLDPRAAFCLFDGACTQTPESMISDHIIGWKHTHTHATAQQSWSKRRESDEKQQHNNINKGRKGSETAGE